MPLVLCTALPSSCAPSPGNRTEPLMTSTRLNQTCSSNARLLEPHPQDQPLRRTRYEVADNPPAITPQPPPQHTPDQAQQHSPPAPTRPILGQNNRDGAPTTTPPQPRWQPQPSPHNNPQNTGLLAYFRSAPLSVTLHAVGVNQRQRTRAQHLSEHAHPRQTGC